MTYEIPLCFGGQLDYFLKTALTIPKALFLYRTGSMHASILL
jgi:hypothetical protein